MSNHHIIIFDGVCNFCNSAVNFIIKRDHKNVFVFSPMQSQSAQSLIKKHGITDVNFDTFILIKNDVCYFRTNAALEITKDLSGYWYLFNFFRIIPSSIRDYIYNLFAKNRYSIFGKADSCMIPTPETKNKFLE